MKVRINFFYRFLMKSYIVPEYIHFSSGKRVLQEPAGAHTNEMVVRFRRTSSTKLPNFEMGVLTWILFDTFRVLAILT